MVFLDSEMNDLFSILENKYAKYSYEFCLENLRKTILKMLSCQGIKTRDQFMLYMILCVPDYPTVLLEMFWEGFSFYEETVDLVCRCQILLTPDKVGYINEKLSPTLLKEKVSTQKKDQMLVDVNDFIATLEERGLVIVSLADYEAGNVMKLQQLRNQLLKRKWLTYRELLQLELLPIKSKQSIENWVIEGRFKKDEVSEDGKGRRVILVSALKRLGYA